MVRRIFFAQDFYSGTIPLILDADFILKHVQGSWKHPMSKMIVIKISDHIYCDITPIPQTNITNITINIMRHVAQPMMTIQECEQITSKHLRLPIKLKYVDSALQYQDALKFNHFKKLAQRL